MLKKTTLIFSLLSILFSISFAQNLQVETILNLNASGGVTMGPDGHLYVSDFGPALGQASFDTKVYQVEYGTWTVNEYAGGFLGASGNRFDSQGNFYQSNPSGGRVSKRSPDGTVDYTWATAGMSGPIGLTNDVDDNLYVCNCGNNTIRKVTPSGVSSLFASSSLFNCPNGITIDPEQNLYVCNFSDGRILKITPNGDVSLFKTLPVYGGVGNGHLTYSNGFLFVATIGVGLIYKISLTGQEEIIAGIAQGFSNNDGPALTATFSKPNGITASLTGDTLFVNCSVPTWPSSSTALHPGLVRMITGVCSLEDVDCPLLTSTQEVIENNKNKYATLSPPHPNPITSNTTLTYQIHSTPQNIRLKIVDASQKLITILEEGRKATGTYTIPLNSHTWAPGIYYCMLENKAYVLTQKIMIVKQ